MLTDEVRTYLGLRQTAMVNANGPVGMAAWRALVGAEDSLIDWALERMDDTKPEHYNISNYRHGSSDLRAAAFIRCMGK